MKHMTSMARAAVSLLVNAVTAMAVFAARCDSWLCLVLFVSMNRYLTLFSINKILSFASFLSLHTILFSAALLFIYR